MLVAALDASEHHAHVALDICRLEHDRLVADDLLQIVRTELQHQVQDAAAEEHLDQLR